MFPFDEANQPIYQQYAQAYDTGQSSGLDHGELLGHVTRFMQQAPPSMQQGVLQQVFSQMEPGQRQSFAGQVPSQFAMDPGNPAQMAQSFQQIGQQQPGLLGQLLGPGGMVSNPIARMALTGIAGLAAKQMMGQGAIR
ncbi:MAG: hypothetical protein M3077_00290 [Candidatus Dormibacteraeota bacterium]|nr:hypothetical protein [Candidatus Dormibacteraeota bacterium]